MSYYDRNNKPMDLETWAYSFETSNRQIGLDKFGDVTVSTVYVGIDMQFGSGPPLIYETMIFGGPLDQDTWRYATETEARQGHAAAVKAAEAAS